MEGLHLHFQGAEMPQAAGLLVNVGVVDQALMYPSNFPCPLKQLGLS